MATVLQKKVFVLPGCEQISVNTLLRDTLGLAEEELQNGHFPRTAWTKKRKFARVEDRGSLISLPRPSGIMAPLATEGSQISRIAPRWKKGGERGRGSLGL